jgi:hypothetical protein
LALARLDGKYGYINRDGEMVLDNQYLEASSFSDDLVGFINTKGEWIIIPQYEKVRAFVNGLAPVKVKRWGFIDTSGKMVISPEYDITAGGFGLFKFEEKGFINGLSRVKTRNGWGYLDTEGNLLGDRWYENLELFK